MNFGPHFSGFASSLDSIIGSGIFRLLETFFEAAPFLLSGVLFAGLMRGMLGHQQLNSLLGGGGFQGALRGWILGISLPVCALGALPVALELKRARLSNGTLLSFTTVAPVMNPISVAYGISHVDFMTFMAFMFGSFFISVALGWGWDSMMGTGKNSDNFSDADPGISYSLQRLKLSGWNLLNSLNLKIVGDLLLVILFMGFLGAILPYGILQGLFINGNIYSPVLMGVFALPIYVTPMEIMTQFEHVVRDGYSIGAAFVLAILGAGANVAVLNWIRRDYGFKRTFSLIIFFFIITLVFSFFMEWLPWRNKVGSIDHTHAFDAYSRLPSSALDSLNFIVIWKEVVGRVDTTQIIGAWILVIGITTSFFVDRLFLKKVGGIESRIVTIFKRQKSKLNKNLESQEKHIPLPTVLAFGLAIAVAGAYFFGIVIYDPPQLTVIKMGDVRGELTQAIIAEDMEQTEEYLNQLDFLTTQLDLGYLLRRFSLPESDVHLPSAYQSRIRNVIEFAHDQDIQAVKNLQGYLYEIFRDIQKTYGN